LRISPSHPRFKSLKTRERLVAGFRNGIVVPQGLIAHGRGEAFDYLLGETTPKSSQAATRAAAALLLSAETPVISVNGNTAALLPRELVSLARSVPAGLEVNLFHRTSVRERRIASVLERNGARDVLGVNKETRTRIGGIASSRREVDRKGIANADVVLVPLEDGDRAEALRKKGKKVIAIDLNPMSRTSQAATVTIVDNITRAIPELERLVQRMRTFSMFRLDQIAKGFDNKRNLASAIQDMIRFMRGWSVN
jgi:4-phosphopantoate---beta-alanine ligase